MKIHKFFNRVFINYILVALIVLAFIVGILIGQNTKQKTEQITEPGNLMGVENVNIPKYLSKDVDFSLFWDAWEIVKENYVDQPVNEVQLLYGAIAGMVDSLNDPHTLLFTPEVNESFLQELNGSFFGIGAEISIKNRQLQVVAPLPNTPAEKAGLRSGDYILKVDDEDMSDKSLDYAVSIIRGEKGTDVILSIYRKGEDAPRDITITRDKIKIESVTWEMLDGNIAHIKLRYFNSDTDKEFRKIADQIIAQNPKAIILDVRNNPGGFLDVSVDIASLFIRNGNVVSEKAFDGTITTNDVNGIAPLSEYSLVVLINEGSASASEILAGAIQDYNLGKVIGMQSFGKGSVQTLYDMKDGSSIKLTVAKWLTPNGNTIEGIGITPDEIIDLTLEDYNNDKDPQLDRAIELLSK